MKLQSLLLTGLVLLAGCSSSSFVNPPPPAYLVPLPSAINGTWANELDNGERVRLSGQEDGTIRFEFFQDKPSPNPPPAKPFLAQTLRFDNADWLLIDFRKLAAWQGEEFTEQAQFRLLKYVLENPDRLCGIEMGPSVFADAIKSGQLAGTVDTSDKRSIRVTVTSPGSEWVKWWTSLPESKKNMGRHGASSGRNRNTSRYQYLFRAAPVAGEKSGFYMN